MKAKITKAKKLMQTLSYDEQCDRFEQFIKANNCNIIGDDKNGKK